ncbi:hypothetical protein ACFVX3_31600 [Rhodococcus erythropolis]
MGIDQRSDVPHVEYDCVSLASAFLCYLVSAVGILATMIGMLVTGTVKRTGFGDYCRSLGQLVGDGVVEGRQRGSLGAGEGSGRRSSASGFCWMDWQVRLPGR